MASSISPILVELLLDDLLDTLSIVSMQVQVWDELGIEIFRMLKKYVDDLFLVILTDALDSILRIFNALEPRFQFTHEIEIDGTLPFLNMKVKRCLYTHGFTCNWYIWQTTQLSFATSNESKD